MNDEMRSIELEIEVQGTVEEVWDSVATGPGVSSWYVPHVIDEHEGGSSKLSFGPGMEGTGVVTVWDPPRRVKFEGQPGEEGLAFQWTVEPREADTCVVRLVNSGFGAGGEWDDHYDGMFEGWSLFLFNLQLHRQHFAGRYAKAMLPMSMWEVGRAAGWERLITALGINGSPNVGDRIDIEAPGAPAFGGTVANVADYRIVLVLDAPLNGTAFISVEDRGGQASASIWSYLYGDDAASVVERDDPIWRDWIGALTD